MTFDYTESRYKYLLACVFENLSARRAKPFQKSPRNGFAHSVCDGPWTQLLHWGHRHRYCGLDLQSNIFSRRQIAVYSNTYTLNSWRRSIPLLSSPLDMSSRFKCASTRSKIISFGRRRALDTREPSHIWFGIELTYSSPEDSLEKKALTSARTHTHTHNMSRVRTCRIHNCIRVRI